MPDPAPAVARRAALVAWLGRQTGPVTGEAIRAGVLAYAEHFADARGEAFKRMLGDDIRALAAVGIGVDVVTGRVDGPAGEQGTYRLVRDPTLLPHDLALTAAEAAALTTAVAVLDRAPHLALGGPRAGRGEVPLMTVSAPPATDAVLSALQDGTSLGCHYSGRARSVRPLQLSTAGGRWYVVVQTPAGALRRLRIDRMTECGPVTDEAEAAALAALPTPAAEVVADALHGDALGFAVDAATTTARLSCRDEDLPTVLAHLPGATQQRLADGRHELAVTTNNREVLLARVIMLRTRCRLEAPDDLRDDLREVLTCRT